MSLFHRRSRSASVSSRPNNASASNAAHSAAAQAFLANRASNANLSNAAAAAALRTMSPPPTNVGQIQTRRMIQRQNSGSSTGSVQRAQSAPRGREYPLERQNSGGSMTERTFRTPSPHGVGRNGQPQPPPVPTVPKVYQDKPPLPQKSHRRTMSVEPPPPRMISPPTMRPAGRGISLDRGANSQSAETKPARVTSLQNLQPPKSKAPRVTSLTNLDELSRIDSNGSANFSYPGRSRPMSPSPSSPTSNQQTTTFPNHALSAATSAGVQYDEARAAGQPIKKKKKKVVRGAAEGSHLQQGGMGNKPKFTPLDNRAAAVPQTAATYETEEQPPIAKKKNKKLVGTGEVPHSPLGRPISPFGGSDSDSTPEKQARRAQRASGQLNKQPSVVREDWEGEQGGESKLNPEARQRADQGLSPVSSPSAAVQGKKQTAANVSRKIDDAALPTVPERQGVYSAVTTAPLLPPDKSLLRVSENDAPSRGPSLSPSRSMRFSDRLSSDLTAGRKHEPLPRSVSPAKSALKHHSPSPTDPRFPGRYIHSHTASEASDNASNVSADAFTTPSRKKKSARVSFDSDPEVVGTAVVEQNDTPILANPQNKELSKRGWFGFSKSKTPALGTIVAEDEMEEVMKPRPALPSFGSVRKGGRPNETAGQLPSHPPASTSGMSHPAQVSSAVSSTASESSGSQVLTMDTSVSSDHAIGGLLAQDAQQKTMEQSQPLPPQVTSVEGTGYVSDEESLASQDVGKSDTHKEAVVSPRLDIPATGSSDLEHVPTISVQPATPGLEQHNEKNPDEWLVSVPGGFPPSTDALSNIATPELVPRTPAGLGIAEPKPVEIISAISPSDAPLTSLRRQSLEKDDTEGSDGDSIYSDAAEDVSEHGDGFGSINAIVESPVVTSSHQQVTTPPESPLAHNFNQNEMRPNGGSRTSSWDQAQSHWSGIAQQSRQGIQQPVELPENQQHIGTSAPAPAPGPVQSYADKKPSMRKKKAARAAPQRASMPSNSPPRAMPMSSPYPPVGTGREIQPVPPPPPFRSSMRPQPESMEPHFRSSMRQRPKSALQPMTRPLTSPQARPMTPVQNQITARMSSGTMPVQQTPPRQRGALQKKHIPAGVNAGALMAARATENAPSPRSRDIPLERTMSNDSDSSSSFKKRHRRGKSSQDSYSMRRSMRAPAESQPPLPAGRGGIRSMSPPRHRRPMSPPLSQKTMRSSMREAAEAPAPTMRSQPEQKRSSSLFGRSKNKSPPPRATPMPLTKKLQSRFAADSDSDDDGPKTFRSRFEDSSDDEPEPLKFRPVRGIPRRADERDSTDLEDSSGDEGRGTQSKPKPLAIETNQASNAVGSLEMPASPSSSTSKKPGFFGRFRGKKNKDGNTKSRLGGTIAERNAMIERNKASVDEARLEENIIAPRKGEISDKKRASQLGFSSIAERDAVLEATRQKLEEAREPSSTNSLPTNGRPAPERIMSDSWPLPPKLPGIHEDRPNTSDGVAFPENARPGLGSRQGTADTARTAGGTPIYGRSGKKKRFPMLRKAFGLVD